MLEFPRDRKIEVICIGRANVDFYTMNRGVSLIEATGFVKYVGGSPANIAVALSRLGTKTGLISKVSDDQLGHYVLNYLKNEGVDIQHVGIDKSGKTRTSIAFIEVKPDNCDTLFYRKEASDLTIMPTEISEEYIKSAKAILISGTALSDNPSREAVFTAMLFAKKHGTLIFFDLDYRASEWEAIEEASVYYTKAAKQADVIIGNKEEFKVMEFCQLNTDTTAMIQQFFDLQAQIVVFKNGEEGSITYTRNEPPIQTTIFPVEVLKPYGAGDAFAGAFIYALLQKKQLTICLKLASAAGAIVVAKESCSEAMPSITEIENFISNY